jgi:hypothetical protein
MRSKLLARLERLETKLPVLIQYDWLNRLPADFEVARHVVVVKLSANRAS